MAQARAIKATTEANPLHHVETLKQMLADAASHARQDVTKISDPKAQALFETTAEVLLALCKACEDFARKNEPAWK